jgi:hypothetical protein
MPLINSINTFKKFVRIAFTSSSENGLPNMETADRKYLLPILGDTLYAALVAEVAGTITHIALVNICRSYVAPMAMIDELATRQVIITDSGIKKTTSQDQENIFRWEYEKLQQSLQEQAAEALNDLWEYLFINANSLSWSSPITDKTIIKTAAEFKMYYLSLQHSARNFAVMQPLMLSVQDMYFKKTIGATFFNELLNAAAPDDDQKEAIDLLKKAAAHLSIARACQILPVSISSQGFTVMMHTTTETTEPGRASVGTTEMSSFRAALEDIGLSYLNDLKVLLNKKASDTVFTTYFNSSNYSDPAATTISRNSTRNGVFVL